MPRYIDAHKVIEKINAWLDCVGTATIGRGLTYYAELMGCIEDTPTEDVENVLHCKDCVYMESATVNKKGYLICPVSGMEITDSAYCSYGDSDERAFGELKEFQGYLEQRLRAAISLGQFEKAEELSQLLSDTAKATAELSGSKEA